MVILPKKNGEGTQYYKEDGTPIKTWNLTNNTTLYAKWIIDKIELDNYEIEDDIILGIPLKVKASKLKLGLDSAYKVIVLDKNDEEKTNEYVGTGNIIQVYLDDKMVYEYIASVKGDVTSDGVVSLADVVKLYQYIKGKVDLEDYEEKSADVANNDKINLGDLSKLYQFVKEKIDDLD